MERHCLQTLALKGIPILFLLVLNGFIFSQMESWCLYHPHAPGSEDIPLHNAYSQQLKEKIQDVYFESGQSNLLNAWYIAPSPGQPIILFAHGNAGTIGNRAGIIRDFAQQGYGIFAFDYRGYGLSSGIPKESGLYQDLAAASQWLTTHKHLPPQQQIALGESLGSGVVVDVATRIPFKAVVLYAPFTSIPDVATEMRHQPGFWWLRPFPVETLFSERFESLRKIHAIRSPILFVHGEHDTLVPPEMSQTLFVQASCKWKKRIVVPGAGHNSLDRVTALITTELNSLFRANLSSVEAR